MEGKTTEAGELPCISNGASPAEIARHVAWLIDTMTLEEKVYMMSGHGFMAQIRKSGDRWGGHPYQAGGGCERLGAPAFYFADGPRGVSRGRSTCFPTAIARGATFDVDLQRRVGEVIGIESRAQGCNLSGAVCVNVLRHPAWGRAQETYGEDPFHIGEMGAALTQGIQAHNVAATVKHFALNSIENARFKVDVLADPRTLREVYLPQFKRIIDAGCASVMSAYNKVNGEYCGQNRQLLTEILRNEWGFEGFVHSDWLRGVYDVYGAVAGLDVENPEPSVFGEHLVAAVRSGAVELDVIDNACRRIMTTLYRFHLAEDPLPDYGPDLVACGPHRALALEAAHKSAILLRNTGILPLERESLRKVAVIGRLASFRNTGDRGSSLVQPPYVVTPLDGLRAALGPDVTILHTDENDLQAVKRASTEADTVVCVVGTTHRDEGEFLSGTFSFKIEEDDDGDDLSIGDGHGGDRDHLRLSDSQQAMIDAAAEVNQRTVVVIISGSAIIPLPWASRVSAILQTLFSGMEGGRALADILLGRIAPSGKLPFTVPNDENELPFFDKDANSIAYDMLHGYTLFDTGGTDPAFAFGFGLSYTTFQYRALQARLMGTEIESSVAVRNSGSMAADEIVQLYVGFPGRAAPRPRKVLRGFQRISLAPGKTRIVRFRVPLEQLRWWDHRTKSWSLEKGLHTIFVGGSSRDADLLKTSVSL